MRLFVTFATLVLAAAAPAHAEILVMGESAAQSCYRSAAMDRVDADAVRHCDIALDEEFLSRIDRTATHINRGILRMRRGQYSQALADFERAEAAGYGHVSALAVNRSAVYLRLGRYDEVLTQAAIAIAADDSNTPHGWFNRGVALEAQGDLNGAYQAFRTAAELRPDWPAPREELRRFSVHRGS